MSRLVGRAALLVAVIGALPGCSTLFDAQPVPLYEVGISANPILLYINDPEYDFPDKKVQGTAWWYINEQGRRVCHVRLRKYPYYLGHEVDHCFREHWHSPLIPNSDDFK